MPSVRPVVRSGRRLLADTFLDRAYLRDRAKVRDTTGGQKETWIERPSAVDCRFVQLKDDDPAISLNSVFGRTTAVLLLPVDVTPVKEGDRVRHAANGSVWVITGNLTPQSELAVATRLGIAQVVT